MQQRLLLFLGMNFSRSHLLALPIHTVFENSKMIYCVNKIQPRVTCRLVSVIYRAIRFLYWSLEIPTEGVIKHLKNISREYCFCSFMEWAPEWTQSFQIQPPSLLSSLWLFVCFIVSPMLLRKAPGKQSASAIHTDLLQHILNCDYWYYKQCFSRTILQTAHSSSWN